MFEKYESSKKEFEQMQQNARTAERHVYESRKTADESPLNYFLYLADKLEEWNKKRMLELAHTLNHEEASKLNEEYEILKQNVIDAA
ncbi:MAG TPA: hypothetical protein VJI70_01050, partial [Candidatus Paceibacterota bacterium]